MSQPDGELSYEISRTYPVSRKGLFDALTNPAVLKRIWGVQQIVVDARLGGKTAAVFVLGNEDWSFDITYTEVRPNESLRWVTTFKGFPTKAIQVTVLFLEVDRGAEVVIRMENFESAEERDANRQAWESALATLADIVQ